MQTGTNNVPFHNDLDSLKSYAKALEEEARLLSDEIEAIDALLEKVYERIDEMEIENENS